jgi:NAD(P) transhydrogenase subunit alpha
MRAMQIGVPRETQPGERRVALTPDMVKRLVRDSHEVSVETGAGARAGFADDAYEAAGAMMTKRPAVLESEVVAAVDAPPDLEGPRVVLGLLQPLEQPELMVTYAARGITAFAFELIPRTTRAQAMDALSSQATIAGYQAVLEGAVLADRLFPMLTTAAGTVPPAKALILGAGVAGLQAIATCRRLGAVVAAFDVRAAAAEQVRSLGASFVQVDTAPQDAATSGGYARALDEDSERRVLAGLAPHLAAADVVISTAAIPGRRAPTLITAEMVESMRPGAVIVDLAATTGGNCELTRPGELHHHRGVAIAGYTDLPARKPFDASQMYARNVTAFLALLGPHGGADFADDILDKSCVTSDGQIRHPGVRELVGV